MSMSSSGNGEGSDQEFELIGGESAFANGSFSSGSANGEMTTTNSSFSASGNGDGNLNGSGNGNGNLSGEFEVVPGSATFQTTGMTTNQTVEGMTTTSEGTQMTEQVGEIQTYYSKPVITQTQRIESKPVVTRKIISQPVVTKTIVQQPIIR